MVPPRFLKSLCGLLARIRRRSRCIPRSSVSPSKTTAKDADLDAATITAAPPSEHEKEKMYEDFKGLTVRLPDLFSDIMAGEYRRNPTYEKVKPEADAWVEEVLHLDAKAARAYTKADLCLLSALWTPNGDDWGLRLVTDWNHWGFPWDDQFDEGHLKFDSAKAADEVIDSLAVFDETQPLISVEENPIRHVIQTVWLHFKERTSIDQQDRFRKLHRKYMLGCLKQTLWASAGYPKLTIDQYMAYRRGSVGAYPAFILVEGAMGIDLPRHVTEHPAIEACELAMTDVIIIHNDILSMRKDLKFGVEHNLVTRLRDLGLSMQEAMDRAGQMLDECFRTWHTNRALIPSWGEPIDGNVAKLLDVYRDVALGCLWWSFETGRYLGPDGVEARRTGILRL